MKKKLFYTASRPTVTTQRVVQTHWWSKCIQFPLISVLSYFHHRNDMTVSLDLDRNQIIIYEEFLFFDDHPIFPNFNLATTIPKRYMQFQQPRLPHPLEKVQETYNPSLEQLFFFVSTLVSTSQMTRRKLANHHKQDFSLFAPISNYKDMTKEKLQIPHAHDPSHQHTPCPNHFLYFLNSLRKI